MPDMELISGLISTYRELNHSVRPLPEEQLQRSNGQGPSAYELLRELRDREMLFSQALKSRTMHAGDHVWSETEMPTLGLESDDDTSAMLIAQFGTARESTLAMLRDLPDAEWDVSEGGKTIRTRVFELLDNDRRQLERIASAIGAR
jgi:hypothetical protein